MNTIGGAAEDGESDRNCYKGKVSVPTLWNRRYFANVTVRDDHFKTKKHKKRVKIMMGDAPHTQLDAELAAGMGMPDNGPKLMSMG
ncbi:hypothetical protein DM860_010361 [Cuscuta australis]|uniref:Uncharacterized protein n=1 Tax=Cuscuta australis TaxID=267555 RepID=A0A328E5B2_9ASTE|nr:hypothetical protein DM860_010361 [Cuscuta australis]